MLQSVEQHIQELLGILLHSHIYRVAFEILKGKTEILWIVLLLLSDLQVGKHLLQLMEQVVVDISACTLNHILRFAVLSHQ